ncbi:MAG: FAD-dependent oxidoreductase, partial [Parvibaculum sp.]
MTQNLPIAIIGAGPVGLAAAARVIERGLEPVVFERGPAAGAAMSEWGHVRVFSPWAFNIDDAAHTLLKQVGWEAPPPGGHPTGADIVDRYLVPLAAHPDLAPRLRFNAEVIGITRQDRDKISNSGRTDAPFSIRWRDAQGTEHRQLASAVIDATGTWGSPNPIGIDGLPVPGEGSAIRQIAYGIPDASGAARADYADKRILVLGGGHSAINVVLDLLRLKATAPETRVTWGLRRNRIDKLLGGGINDQLPERGALGLAARQAIDKGLIEVLTPFAVETIDKVSNGLRLGAVVAGHRTELTVDRIVVATGFRPQLDMLRELRIGLDPVVEATPKLAPLIDPNFHSCGSVRPHGAAELA